MDRRGAVRVPAFIPEILSVSHWQQRDIGHTKADANTSYVLIEVSVFFIAIVCSLAVRSSALGLRSVGRYIYTCTCLSFARPGNGCQWGAGGQRYSWRERRRPTNKQTRKAINRLSMYTQFIYLYLVATHSHKMSSTTTPRSLLLVIMATAICMLPLSAAQSGPQAALIPPCVVRSFLSRSLPFSGASRFDENIEFVADHHRVRRTENLRPPGHRLRQLHARRPILSLRAPGRDSEQHFCLCGEEL